MNGENVLRKTLLCQVREVEEREGERIRKDKWGMRFHVMPPVGWLNDPNGLCFYQGEYYCFFQYSPFDAEGGLKLWGECVSRDLTHWEYKGAVLFPDSKYDCHGVYSGCAYTGDGRLELFYTGNVRLDGGDSMGDGREANVVRTESADGRHFSPKECLLAPKDYPAGFTSHIRDPKVWKEDSRYYMALGARRGDDRGAALIYVSGDKRKWELYRELTTPEPFGYMWECPDLFDLDGCRLLSVSPQGVEREEFRYQNVYQSGYFPVEETEGQWVLGGFAQWDMGFDFYAPQTFQDGKGRRILIAWAGLPDVDNEYTNPTVENGWQHVLTTPRRLSLREGRVCQTPVEEINALRGERITLLPGEKALIPEDCFDLEIRGMTSGGCRLTIEDQLVLSCEGGVFQMEFTGPMGSGRTVRRARTGELRSLRILADTSLLEVYVNDGETVFTTRYYPEGRTRRLEYEAGGGVCLLWTMGQSCFSAGCRCLEILS